MNSVLAHLLLLFSCIAVIATLPIPRKIKLFVVESKPSQANNSQLVPLPFGKRLPTTSEEQTDYLQVLLEDQKQPNPAMGRSLGRRMQGRGLQGANESEMGTTSSNTDDPPVNSNTEIDTTDTTDAPIPTEAYTGPPLEKERQDLQSEQFEELMEQNLTEPIEEEIISPDAPIFAHVLWYEDYFEDTRIEIDEVNPFEYDFFGSCLPKKTDVSTLHEFESSDDIVEFYAVMLKEYCHTEIVKIYKRLTNMGYLTIGTSKFQKYLSIVPGTPLLTMTALTTDELRSLMRLLKISAYSEVVSSLILNPVAAFDPKFRELSYRAFTLVNTILHMLDLILYHAAHLYTEVVRSLYKRMLVMGREVFCRYADSSQNVAQKQRGKNDAIATTILMEYLSKCAILPEDCVHEDAHDGYRKIYLDEELQLFTKYKPKIEALHHKPSFRRVCNLMFPLLN